MTEREGHALISLIPWVKLWYYTRLYTVFSSRMWPFFMKIKFSATEACDFNLHSGGPKSKNSHFKGDNVRF